MARIREASQKVKDAVVLLSDSIKQQVTSVGELASVLGNIGEMSQSISAATEQLAGLARQLQQITAAFKPGDDGASGAPETRPAASPADDSALVPTA